jgi:lipoic acid synthetase
MPAELPDWLKKGPANSLSVKSTRDILERSSLHTVCVEAHCPNLGECYARGTAAFLIMGDTCTRHCGFCKVHPGTPRPLDALEPGRVAEVAATLGLTHVVVTSVTRDDLADGGAGHYAETIGAIRRRMPGTVIEVLIPDLAGSLDALQTVLSAGPDILNHNLETVPRLYPAVRPQADYARSLELLARAGKFDATLNTKSGIMLGLGEDLEEVKAVLQDLKSVGCDMVTVGQYLRPGKENLPVSRYVTPQEFEEVKSMGLEMGIPCVESGPFVRSSYRAGETFTESQKAKVKS